DYVEVDLEIGGKRTKAGVRITSKNALSIGIVWSCVKILCESVSGLPLKLYDDQDGKRVLVPYKDRAARVLRKPNPYMTR
ncbi:HK97 family phage portal protein, partial [Pseudomonas syringae pv. actinidiae ICMP 19068]